MKILEISAKVVAELDTRTEASFVDCQNAFVEADKNAEEMYALLRKKAIAGR